MPRGFAPSKKDAIQPAVEDAFRQAGWSVEDIHMTPNGFDLIVAKRNHTIVIECKTGRRKRTPEQIAKALNWQGDYLYGNDPLLLLERAEESIRE